MDPSLPRPAPRPSPTERVRDWVVWFGAARLVATSLAVIAVAVGGAWLVKGAPSRPEDALPFAARSTTTMPSATGSSTAPITTVLTSIVVYVAGEVAAPGVYTLPPSARVNDALVAAGGARPNADLGVVNLAAPVHDGERVYVPAIGATIPPTMQAVTADEAATVPGPVNINTATAEQLDVLPGVGPATAAAIIAHRQQRGPFQSVEELADVRGIGPAKLEALRGLVTV